MPSYNYGGSPSFVGGENGYTSSGGAGDPSGYKRNVKYSYSGGNMDGGGYGSSPRMAAVPRIDMSALPHLETNINPGQNGGNMAMYNMQNANNFLAQQAYGPMLQAQLREREAAQDHNYDMEKIQMQIESEEQARQRALRDNLMQGRYADYRRYGR